MTALARLTAAAEAKGQPISVTVQVTDRCNYSCVHCYQEHDRADELTTAEIEGIFAALRELNVMFLVLVGGEFFMRRDADHLLRVAHQDGFALRVLSTGHHITDKRADFLATLKPIELDLSLYGSNAAIHERVTDQRGSFKRTVDAAERLLKRGVPVTLKVPVMESNAGDMKDLTAFASSLGAKLKVDPFVTSMENADQSPVSLRMGAGALARFYNEQDEEVSVAAARRQTPPDSGGSCGVGQRGFYVKPNGDVWPCSSLSVSVGNVRSTSLHDIWYGSQELEEVRGYTWATLSECRDCPVRRFCARCHGMALLEQGNARGPSLEACRHAVASRDALRAKGHIPATHTEMPPTWDRVEKNGQHHAGPTSGVRPTRLRVI